MNYLKVYNALIEKRKRSFPTEYFEIHHIKPRSLFPDLIKDENNLVKLTYREHYIAHWLLTKIYPGQKMTYAFWRMNCCQNNRYFNSCAYEKNRKDFSKLNHLPKKEETKRKLSLANKGKQLSEEHKAKISKALKGRIISEEAKAKISKARKGKSFCKGIKKPSINYSIEMKKRWSNEDYRKKMLGKSFGGKNYSLGKHWYTNGITNILSFEQPNGFRKGRIKINRIKD